MTTTIKNRPTPGPTKRSAQRAAPKPRRFKTFPTEILPAEMSNSTDPQRQIFKADGPARPLLAVLIFVLLVALALAMIFAVTKNVITEC